MIEDIVNGWGVIGQLFITLSECEDTIEAIKIRGTIGDEMNYLPLVPSVCFLYECLYDKFDYSDIGEAIYKLIIATRLN